MTEPSGGRLFDLDPTGMWRLFTDVQRLGFETAATVARRFGQIVEEDLGPRAATSSTPTGPSNGASPEERLAATAQAAVDAYAELMQASWDAFNAVAELAMRPWPWIGGHPASSRLDLPVVTAGGVTSGSVYVHNTSPSPLHHVDVATDGLIGPDGAVIKPKAVRFTPGRVDDIGPGKHAAVEVAVSVSGKAPPGRYVGVIRAFTTPPTEIVLAVEVASPKTA